MPFREGFLPSLVGPTLSLDEHGVHDCRQDPGFGLNTIKNDDHRARMWCFAETGGGGGLEGRGGGAHVDRAFNIYQKLSLCTQRFCLCQMRLIYFPQWGVF